jgi:hypothetical protein
MKGKIQLILCLILFILAACQNNSEKIIDKKIAKIDNRISSSQPSKTKNTKQFFRFNITKKINRSYISNKLLSQEDLRPNNNIYAGLSDEMALSVLFSNLTTTTEIFYLNPKKDTSITGTKGTIVEIKAESFVNARGKTVAGTVRFEVTEYMNKSEFIYARLSTNANKGGALESKGILLLKAYSNNETLSLAKEKMIRFQIPTNSIKENMKLFSGVRDVHGNVKWYERNNKITKRKIRKSEKKLAKIKKENKQRVCVDVMDTATIEQETSLFAEGLAHDKVNRVEYYIFNTTQLGYINAARFVQTKSSKPKFILEDKKFEKSNVNLVFKNYNSMLPGIVENGKVDFGNVPIGEDVTIVAIRMENGIPMLYMEEIKTTRGKSELLVKFKPVSFAELKEEMKKLNK